MTNDDYTRIKIGFRLGHYSFFWRLMTFPLAASWRQRRSPARIDWYVFVENPHQETEELLAWGRRRLAEHPEDTMNQFTLGNVLRMDGQIAAAREQYEQVVLTGQGHWVQQAKDILKKLEGVPDHRPGRSSHVLYHNFYRQNKGYIPKK
jgi:hypothetical protein